MAASPETASLSTQRKNPMPESFTAAERSRIMRAVKSENTKPESIVGQIVHRLGYRFRRHRRDLPGKPDLVLSRHRKVIFVHGCFWHLHSCAHAQRAPVRNAEYWQRKRLGNAVRDQRAKKELRQLGWRVLEIWECQLRRPETVAQRVRSFLQKTRPGQRSAAKSSLRSAAKKSPLKAKPRRSLA